MVVFSSYACVVLFAGLCPELGSAVDADPVPAAGVVAGVVDPAVVVLEAAAVFISLAMESVSPRIAITCSSSLNCANCETN